MGKLFANLDRFADVIVKVPKPHVDMTAVVKTGRSWDIPRVPDFTEIRKLIEKEVQGIKKDVFGPRDTEGKK
jgi:hypothetical protein